MLGQQCPDKTTNEFTLGVKSDSPVESNKPAEGAGTKPDADKPSTDPSTPPSDGGGATKASPSSSASTEPSLFTTPMVPASSATPTTKPSSGDNTGGSIPKPSPKPGPSTSTTVGKRVPLNPNVDQTIIQNGVSIKVPRKQLEQYNPRAAKVIASFQKDPTTNKVTYKGLDALPEGTTVTSNQVGGKKGMLFTFPDGSTIGVSNNKGNVEVHLNP